jgi:hypothetical protein
MSTINEEHDQRSMQNTKERMYSPLVYTFPLLFFYETEITKSLHFLEETDIHIMYIFSNILQHSEADVSVRPLTQ